MGLWVAAMDWRGQGGSPRLLKNSPRRGHARRMRDYERDLDLFLEQIVLPDAKLHRGVSRLRLVRYGHHEIRFGLDDRDRNLLPLLVEDLGHAQLFTDDANHEILMLSHCR